MEQTLVRPTHAIPWKSQHAPMLVVKKIQLCNIPVVFYQDYEKSGKILVCNKINRFTPNLYKFNSESLLI